MRTIWGCWWRGSTCTWSSTVHRRQAGAPPVILSLVLTRKRGGLLTDVIYTAGVLAHLRSRLSSRYTQRQHYPCTTWRHQLESVNSGPTITAASAHEVVIQHSLRRPGRSKEGFKFGYASKTRSKSLKIFREPGRLFIQSVPANDSESQVNEEKKEEDLLNKCMQLMSIEEQGEHVMLTWQSRVLMMRQSSGKDCELCLLTAFRTVLLVTTKSLILVCS